MLRSLTGGIASLDPRLPSGIPPGCLHSPPRIYSAVSSEESFLWNRIFPMEAIPFPPSFRVVWRV